MQNTLCFITRQTVMPRNTFIRRLLSERIRTYCTPWHTVRNFSGTKQQLLVTDVVSDEKSQLPGLGMKLTVAGLNKKFPNVKNISTGQLSNWIKQAKGQTNEQMDTGTENLVILDTRFPKEYKVGHIPGSLQVNFKSDAEDIVAKIPQLHKNGPMKVVCYCSIGFRGSTVAQKLEELFIKQGASDQKSVYNLNGSIFQWANEGRSMVDANNKPTIYAHPFNALFGKYLRRELRKSELP